MNPPSGMTVVVTTSVDPAGRQKNVVVMGQDPEEEGICGWKLGVTI
jgi:hypothetical protein